MRYSLGVVCLLWLATPAAAQVQTKGTQAAMTPVAALDRVDLVGGMYDVSTGREFFEK